MKAEAGADQSFASLLHADYASNFGNSQAILKNLTDTLTPIVEAGPNQEGFSTAELNARNTAAIDRTKGNYENAARAVGGQLAGRSDDSGLESGVEQQIKGDIASAGAGELSNEENQITQEDYATGRANYESAVSGLGGVAAAYNPNGTAGAATSAGSTAFGESQANTEASNALGKDILGGITLGGEAAITAGLGGHK